MRKRTVVKICRSGEAGKLRTLEIGNLWMPRFHTNGYLTDSRAHITFFALSQPVLIIFCGSKGLYLTLGKTFGRAIHFCIYSRTSRQFLIPSFFCIAHIQDWALEAGATRDSINIFYRIIDDWDDTAEHEHSISASAMLDVASGNYCSVHSSTLRVCERYSAMNGLRNSFIVPLIGIRTGRPHGTIGIIRVEIERSDCLTRHLLRLDAC